MFDHDWKVILGVAQQIILAFIPFHKVQQLLGLSLGDIKQEECSTSGRNWSSGGGGYSMKNGWVVLIYMSITVKVQFGDKLFKLSPGITSLQQVHQEMVRRYPKNLPALEYFFEGRLLTDLSPLLQALSKAGKTSLKLTARSNSADLSRESDYSLIQIVSSEEGGSMVRKAEESVVLLPERLVQVRPRVELPSIRYDLPQDFYLCYNCEGKGLFGEEFDKLCNICQGRGELNNDHKYIQRLKLLFGRHGGKPEVKREEPKVEAKREEVVGKSDFPRVFRALSKNYQLTIAEVNKIEKMEVGKEFTCQFQISNLGKNLPEELQLVSCETKESRKVNTIRSGEKMIVQVGPFKCETEALLERAFYLCYRVQDGWERLGYRFGLRVRGVKNVEMRKMEQSGRELIQNLKVLSGSKKSVEYIEMKLKDMKIDLNKLEMEDEILIEIIRHIQ